MTDIEAMIEWNEIKKQEREHDILLNCVDFIQRMISEKYDPHTYFVIGADEWHIVQDIKCVRENEKSGRGVRF